MGLFPQGLKPRDCGLKVVIFLRFDAALQRRSSTMSPRIRVLSALRGRGARATLTAHLAQRGTVTT